MAQCRAAPQSHLDRLDSAVDGWMASEGDHFLIAFAGLANAISAA